MIIKIIYFSFRSYKIATISLKTVLIDVVIKDNFQIYNAHNVHTLRSIVSTHGIYFLYIALIRKKNAEKDLWLQGHKKLKIFCLKGNQKKSYEINKTRSP